MASKKAQVVLAANARNKERHHRRRCHFGRHNSKQGKSSLCRLFYRCINSVEGTRAPEARTCDHPGLAKGGKGEKPKEVLWFHAFRC
ncbi:hypothetical protein ACFX11_000064 [Malus domestica]